MKHVGADVDAPSYALPETVRVRRVSSYCDRMAAVCEILCASIVPRKEASSASFSVMSGCSPDIEARYLSQVALAAAMLFCRTASSRSTVSMRTSGLSFAPSFAEGCGLDFGHHAGDQVGQARAGSARVLGHGGGEHPVSAIVVSGRATCLGGVDDAGLHLCRRGYHREATLERAVGARESVVAACVQENQDCLDP